MKKFGAFTLAEIIIALAVIGIIAAIVLPNNISGARTKAAITAFKTTYNQVQQGLITGANVHRHSFVQVGDGSNNTFTLDRYMQHHFNARTLTPWQPSISTPITVSYGSAITGVSNSDFTTISNAYRLKNGIAILFPNASIKVMTQKGCSYTTPCLAYLDVNGSAGPNLSLECASGSTSSDILASCIVAENSISDVFPILIKKNHIFPASNAVNYVLNN